MALLELTRRAFLQITAGLTAAAGGAGFFKSQPLPEVALVPKARNFRFQFLVGMPRRFEAGRYEGVYEIAVRPRGTDRWWCRPQWWTSAEPFSEVVASTDIGHMAPCLRVDYPGRPNVILNLNHDKLIGNSTTLGPIHKKIPGLSEGRTLRLDWPKFLRDEEEAQKLSDLVAREIGPDQPWWRHREELQRYLNKMPLDWEVV